MMIFHGNLRKITENFENFVAKILKMSEKMYTLNRYAGNINHISRHLAPSALSRLYVRGWT